MIHHEGNTKGICREHNDIARMPGQFGAYDTRKVGERLQGSVVVRETVVIQLETPYAGADGHIFQDGTEA